MAAQTQEASTAPAIDDPATTLDQLISQARPTKSKLGRYRKLSDKASVFVSPITLGTMTFGQAWDAAFGTCPKDEAEKIFNYYVDMGGNIIDTAIHYQNGESETWLGVFMAKRGCRDSLVVATKFSGLVKDGFHDVNNEGNARKNMILSIERSLKRLQTTYIDIYYIHYWTYLASPEEVMSTFHSLVMQGKVLYPAISDAPAWVVAKANMLAEQKGWTPFVLYQGQYNPGTRDLEREVLPMCLDFGMTVTPWGVMGGGKYTGKYKRGDTDKEKGSRSVVKMTEKDFEITAVLERIALKHQCSSSQVCIAWVLAQRRINTVILGQRTLKQLQDNIAALDVDLDKEDLAAIGDVTAFDVGFPHNFLGGTRWEEIRTSKMASKVWDELAPTVTSK
ncbi:Aldo/keto reductase [Gonapodya prolifera JEL478]|uniref:Aldo/keto reductase n=1 Tax=Gonapodya prolifera (strain JEL478) TaxID=1344416 RepID=A0A139A611_GONPJ|nr:Aldo/keto reductase [Gonapodya prolifera JEL478]|eukprot:KXS12099.1 Aldo/keto reductase [Gonapodya prolifera JEL478]